ncbi:50S ribosomal protein L23 [Aerococcus kribbianus]|uniref:Large ribosomal subunit protein uL23 n=1 Tax=Aerococcus kribbianus TaxID=2999064 RepID=A0A9X3JGH8_9LACT|nr:MULTISPECIES: 50S ribosomal protein L23 [unclassified Aerococcus]MCZ0718056.1 50S ribosomal protein L23 [Aerococcus sp. YH-aer221]MCZ0726375.1 50S ribosomal protein L23 [Aerococcus sp. YH-aer222]
MLAQEIIIRPIITEQSMMAMEDNKYTFEVDRRANKTEVKQAVEELFDVKVEKVNILNVRGKLKRMGRYAGFTRKRRKAVVKVAEGQSIEIFGADDAE